MTSARRSLLSVVLLLTSAAVLPAQIPAAIQNVKSWRVTYSVSGVGEGTLKDPNWVWVWSFHTTASGTTEITTGDGRNFSGVNNTSVQCSLTSSKTAANEGHDTYYANGSFTGSPTKQDVLKANVHMGKDGWNLQFTSTTVTFKADQGYTDSTGDHKTGGNLSYDWTPIFTGPYPYPQTGTTLNINGKKKEPLLIGQTPSSLSEGLEYTYNITLTPLDKTELKLEITSDGYDNWRPDANRDGSAGKPLKFNAQLKNADGSLCKAQVVKWVWTLEKTSREPGIALNWPLNANDKDYDLRLDAGELTVHDDTLQWAEKPNPDPKKLTDEMSVKPYDWGGWSTLTVKAVLIDQRTVEGEFKPTKEKTIRLPKRDKDSFIADVWKKGKNVSADADDKDSKPAGDTTAGDGLTNYEEYRGFYEKGKHIEGDPDQKDFFIRNRTAAVAQSGILQFSRISALKTHYELTEDELPADRVINKNHSQGPHAVDQHGIIVEVDPNLAGVSKARGGPSTPKGISIVSLCKDAASWDSGELRSTVAHELMHCVNVYHHGRGDLDVQWTLNAASKLMEGGTEIQVQTEAGEDASAQFIFTLQDPTTPFTSMRKGVPGGQHSGFENCVMRYDDAEIYASQAVPTLRYYIEEIPGHALCHSDAGSGVNADGRSPQSRYFKASIGKCSGQILVNDAISPPAR